MIVSWSKEGKINLAMHVGWYYQCSKKLTAQEVIADWERVMLWATTERESCSEQPPGHTGQWSFKREINFQFFMKHLYMH